MRCPFCGQRLLEGSKHCPACGNTLTELLNDEPENQGGYPYDDNYGNNEYNDNRYENMSHNGDGYDRDASRWGNGSAYGENDRWNNQWAKRRSTQYEADSRPMPMKWFKFLIYVSLILTGVGNIYIGYATFNGSLYGDADVAAQVYALYSGLQVIDKIYGLALVVFGVCALYVRQQMARYRRQAPKRLLILYTISILLSVVYLVLVMFATGMNTFDLETLGSLGVSALMVFVNKIYFDKRNHLFVN